MLLAKAAYAALLLGRSRSLTLVENDGAAQLTVDEVQRRETMFRVADRVASQGKGVAWEPEKTWESEKVRKGVANPLILLNSHGRSLVKQFSCALPCTISTRESDIPKADAFVMNFCSPGKLGMPPNRSMRPAGQKLVMTYDYEAADDLFCQYRNRLRDADVDWTMTYRPDSDVVRPLFAMEPRREEHTSVHSAWFGFSVKSSAVPNANQIDWSKGRDKLVLWFISNCEGKGERLNLGRKLQKLLPPGQMDIFGHCGEKSPCEGNNEMDRCHQNLFKRYKFYAALENTRCSGYLTEKWARAMVQGMVPLVRGGKGRSDYEKVGLPRDSFIHWDDYNTTEQLAEALKQLGANQTKYGAFHSWRATHRIVTDEETNSRSLCALCGKLLEKNASQSHRSGDDLAKWWLDDTCTHSDAWFRRRAGDAQLAKLRAALQMPSHVTEK